MHEDRQRDMTVSLDRSSGDVYAKLIVVDSSISRPGCTALNKQCVDTLWSSVKKRMVQGLERYGSVVKSTECSSRGPEFNSQKPHSLQPSVMRSGALSGIQAYMQTEYCTKKRLVQKYTPHCTSN